MSIEVTYSFGNLPRIFHILILYKLSLWSKEMKLGILLFNISFIFAQYEYSLEDLNPSSDYYGDSVGTSYFTNKLTLHYFGHYT